MSPQETIIWAKTHQPPHFPPGKGFNYPDTNYHLLGLIIEKITGIPLSCRFESIYLSALRYDEFICATLFSSIR